MFKTLNAQLTPNCHLVMLCIIGYKSYPHLWNVQLTPNTVKASRIQYPTIFWLYQKINNQLMISPHKKKKIFFLHLRNGMRGDSLLLKNVSRASLVAQWLRVCLPMQGTQVRALVWEDPTCRGATGPVSHNY